MKPVAVILGGNLRRYGLFYEELFPDYFYEELFPDYFFEELFLDFFAIFVLSTYRCDDMTMVSVEFQGHLSCLNSVFVALGMTK